jgi:carbonic anhydrase/acetyltransferase-like protein (isoleucine patch superfamily)
MPIDMLSATVLDRLQRASSNLGPKVGSIDLAQLSQNMTEVDGSDVQTLQTLGITIHGRKDCKIVLQDTSTLCGRISIHNTGANNCFLFNNKKGSGAANVTLRTHGSECTALICDLSVSPLNIFDVFFRSNEQLLYFGEGSTSVGVRVELQGTGRTVAIGDDCMLSSDVWIRNHDMHTIFVVDSEEITNMDPLDVIIEKHVWLGFDSLIFGARRIGFGSIVGTRALVRQELPALVLAVGIPARVIRNGVSWCRQVRSVDEATLAYLKTLKDIPGP